MNADDDSSEIDQGDDAPGSFRWPISWGVMLALGWGVFEITAQPRFGIAVTCTKLAWSDLADGWWWFQRDPSLLRGVSGLLVTWCRGLLKYAGAVLVLGITWVAIDPNLNGNRGGIFLNFQIGMLAMKMSIAFSGTAFLVATFGRVRIWLDGDFVLSRRADRFPLECPAWNQTPFILIFPLMIFAIKQTWVLSKAIDIPALFGLFPVWAIPIPWMVVGVIAKTPDDCWNSQSPPSELEERNVNSKS